MRDTRTRHFNDEVDATDTTRRFSIALTESLHDDLCGDLLARKGEENLVFGLYRASLGATRKTALLHHIIPALEGERFQHGNASFASSYIERASSLARSRNSGLVLLHSHLGPGWQGMSADDVVAERQWAPYVESLTGMPFIGMTLGTDGSWSGRCWEFAAPHEAYMRNWADCVRVVGKLLRTTWLPDRTLRRLPREELRRTRTTWGPTAQDSMAQLRVGIVGLGSVGMMVAEILARMGMRRLSLIDFDRVERHNLDRLVGCSSADIGRPKVEAALRLIRASATEDGLDLRCAVASVVEEEGYLLALDCDAIFSCVDRPWPRAVLNHIAYAHAIPVIDGGIAVRFRDGVCSGFDWQLQTVGPGRPCLDCLGVFSPADVGLEMEGKLDDASYLSGLSENHRLRRNESVFPLTTNLASLEVLQFVALATGVAGMDDVGIQRMRWQPGVMECWHASCRSDCDFARNTLAADSLVRPISIHRAAERMRKGR